RECLLFFAAAVAERAAAEGRAERAADGRTGRAAGKTGENRRSTRRRLRHRSAARSRSLLWRGFLGRFLLRSGFLGRLLFASGLLLTLGGLARGFFGGFLRLILSFWLSHCRSSFSKRLIFFHIRWRRWQRKMF